MNPKGMMIFAAALLLASSQAAVADYETYPELHPDHRCAGVPYVDGDGVTHQAPAIPPSHIVEASGHDNQGQIVFKHGANDYRDDRGNSLPGVTDADVGAEVDPGGVDSLHCQKLWWDIPSPSEIGAVVIGAPYAADTVPRWPNGLADRLPPLYTDGTNGYESDGPGRTALCPEHTVPWWAPVFDQDGDGEPDEGRNEPILRSFDELGDVAAALTAAGRDSYVYAPLGNLASVDDPNSPQYGEVYRLDCRRGSRTYYGPWQTGTDPNRYDAVFPGQAVRFESTARMDADVVEGRICEGEGEGDTCTCEANDPRPMCASLEGEAGEIQAHGRREWNTGSDFYNHFASHHGTCWNPETSLTSGALEPSYQCNDPDDPWAASDTGPGGECEDYQAAADPGGSCDAADAEPRCSNSPDGQMFRNATQYPGRLYVEIPDGRGVVSLEDQLWRCDHHVVTQLPPGSYSMTKLANYRLQKGGVRNPRTDEGLYGAGAGEYIGGSVGQMVMQYYTEAFTDPTVKSVNVQFEVIQDAATTWYPPFTFHAHKVTWYAPFDLAIGLITTHSHHRNSIGFMDITPANPLRTESSDPACGAAVDGVPAEHVYLNTNWEDAKLCEYWKQPDGPLVMRKGQAIQTTCYVNNGVTPEAIKHGLVAGAAVEAFRAYNEVESGDPVIPDQPSTVPTSTWGDLFAQSPVGTEFLYGTHPTINYRVAYKCSDNPVWNPIAPFAGGFAGDDSVCNPNPAVDADGDYIDGPYVNEDQCGAGRWCMPSTIIFANVGEDEMCIPVFMYWPLDYLVNQDGSINEEAMANLQEGNIDEVGTPGKVQKWPGDIGDCRDCPSPAAY